MLMVTFLAATCLTAVLAQGWWKTHFTISRDSYIYFITLCLSDHDGHTTLHLGCIPAGNTLRSGHAFGRHRRAPTASRGDESAARFETSDGDLPCATARMLHRGRIAAVADVDI